MQQFALVSVYPRSIAWLLRPDEWERFEKIVTYNCAIAGGYYNVFIPLTEEDRITEAYQKFLIDYDPDLIVLAPEMDKKQLGDLLIWLHPFGTVPWEAVRGIISKDPLSSVTGLNAPPVIRWKQVLGNLSAFYIAAADHTYPDTSKLALIACGDIAPTQAMFNVFDKKVSLDATGYREHILKYLLRDDVEKEIAGAYLNGDQDIINAPDRYRLNKIIADEHKFPLTKARRILHTCCKLQHFPTGYPSFIGLTISYKTGQTRTSKNWKSPSLIILVSEHFGLQEAILFWNLRANNLYVAWLSFEMFEAEQNAVLQWLESDSGGVFYSMIALGGSYITFATSEKTLDRLGTLLESLGEKREESHPKWVMIPCEEFIYYDYSSLPIKTSRVSIIQHDSKHVFVPQLPDRDFNGTFTVELKWDGFMLPQHNELVLRNISTATLPFLDIHFEMPKSSPTFQIFLELQKFRISRNYYLKVQTDNETPIEFTRPTAEQIIETLLTTSYFHRLERSSTARYHTLFVNRAGGLDEAAKYLSVSPYRELFTLLADNNDKRKTGWILTDPSKRRAFHHLHLRDVLRKQIPLETSQFFNTVSDELPIEAFHLLEKNLLERGFRLKCNTCSFHSWYPAEEVGQTFKCARCFHIQVYDSHPLWLYKLPEVIFQGFEDNMQVPLLALFHLKSKSKHCFEWIPDSDIFWNENDKELHGNIDILCLSDGRFYIGEAKSNDEIKADQFSFYEDICMRVPIDGIVFATTRQHWNRATQQRIDALKARFKGEVIVLTEQDLYPPVASS